MQEYQFSKIEQKWQKYWDENKTFKTDSKSSKPKFYALDMFPYPSGAGLHVGHPEGYTATDIIARMKRMQGYEVMHPMGWDAFGLPAEQYALQTGNNPNEFTQKNIETFKKQIQSLGFSYDWDRELSTTNPDYYKWTQWIFLQLHEKGLTELKEVPVNFCPECKTVLANEEVINGKCERKGHDVIKKPMRQWVLKITEYADRLLDDLDDLDWPESLKDMQRNWIGKSVGATINFPIENSDDSIDVYTTRPDTIYGVTYLVIAAENSKVKNLTTVVQQAKGEDFLQKVVNKSDLERTELNKDKQGIFTGSYAIHPLTGRKIPVWIGDYVLNTYGSGAVMAVPAHDERDYAFAQKYNLEVIKVIDNTNENGAFVGDGKHINSETIDGLNNDEASQQIIEILEQQKMGSKKVNYKLRDWLFSRQRYWGEPFPIYFDQQGNIKMVDETDLPIELPNLDKIEPSPSGDSPLTLATEWLKYKDGQLDTNTMPQWAGSCWYYLRYLDPDNTEELVDKKIASKWLPVDLYIGGAEHAVLHLLYTRFWHKFLFDIGVVDTPEPFQKVYNQGMILGENNEKMSKSKGNVINPDQIVISHGADALRIYEMFMGPLDASIPWSENGLDGSKKFLDRVFKLYQTKEITAENKNLDKIYAQTVQKVENDFDKLAFNTAISALMIFLNSAQKESCLSQEQAEGFLKLLSPIAPHLCEELWEQLGHNKSISFEQWPEINSATLIDDEQEATVQINGKIRARIDVPIDISKEDFEQKAKKAVENRLEDVEIIKVIVIAPKFVNFVVKK